MSAGNWRHQLDALVFRFPEYGAGVDLAALSASEAWGLFRFLTRVADGNAHD